MTTLRAVFEPIEAEIRLLNARLARADEHYRSFGKIWADYLDSGPHRLQHTEEGDGVVVVRLRRARPVPAELSVVFGELLYELRSALDNCLYAVAVMTSGQNPPPSAQRLEWPIRETPTDWKSQASRYRDLPLSVVEALETIQPYRAECPGWNSLQILHDLARVDRHRTPHGLGVYLAWLRAAIDPESMKVLNPGEPCIVHDGDEIFRVLVADGVTLSPDNFDLDVELEVDVTDIREVPGPSGTLARPWGSLDTRLNSLVKAVDEYTHELLGLAADHIAAGPSTT